MQSTAEAEPFDRAKLETLLNLADRGIATLIERQRDIVGKILKY